MRVNPLLVGWIATLGQHRQQCPAFKAQRHQPAGIERIRHVQETAVGPFADHRVAECLAVARAERRFHGGDGRSHGGKAGMLFHHPAGAEIPPAQRRERRVKACACQCIDGRAIHAGRPRQEAYGGGLLAHVGDQRAPTFGRQAGRGFAAEASDAQCGPAAQLLRPPRQDGIGGARVVVSEGGDLQVGRRQARVQRVAVFGVADEPVGMIGSQRRINRHAIDHEIQQ